MSHPIHPQTITTDHRFSKTRSAIRLPAQVCRAGAILLDQQMWCWGCDVRRSAGNLLLAYGAQKRPSPSPRYHSAYSFRLSEAAALNLWGWGIWIADEEHGSLLLSRARFRALYTPETHLFPAAWCEPDLPCCGAAHDGETAAASLLLAALFRWISRYEVWLSGQVACDYREQVMAAWPQNKRYRGGFSPSALAHHWLALSDMLVQPAS